MKENRKRFIALLAAVCIAASAAGCGSESNKSDDGDSPKTTAGGEAVTTAAEEEKSDLVDEAQMAEDIEENVAVIKDNGFSNVAVTVDKRLTNEDAKEDSVYVNVTAENDKCKANFYFILKYLQFNDGWGYDSYEEDKKDTWGSEPKADITQSELVEAVNNFGSTSSGSGSYHIEENEVSDFIVEQDNGAEKTYSLSKRDEHKYATVFNEYKVNCNWSNETYDYIVTSISESSTIEWNALGTWKSDSSDEMNVEITFDKIEKGEPIEDTFSRSDNIPGDTDQDLYAYIDFKITPKGDISIDNAASDGMESYPINNELFGIPGGSEVYYIVTSRRDDFNVNEYFILDIDNGISYYGYFRTVTLHQQ